MLFPQQLFQNQAACRFITQVTQVRQLRDQTPASMAVDAVLIEPFCRIKPETHPKTVSTKMNHLSTAGLLMPLSGKLIGVFVVYRLTKQRALHLNILTDESHMAKQEPANFFF